MTTKDTKVNFEDSGVGQQHKLIGDIRRHHDLLAWEGDALGSDKGGCLVILIVCICFVTSINRAVGLEELVDARILLGDIKI